MSNLYFVFWHIDNNANTRDIAILNVRFPANDCNIYSSISIYIHLCYINCSIEAFDDKCSDLNNFL